MNSSTGRGVPLPLRERDSPGCHRLMRTSFSPDGEWKESRHLSPAVVRSDCPFDRDRIIQFRARRKEGYGPRGHHSASLCSNSASSVDHGFQALNSIHLHRACRPNRHAGPLAFESSAFQCLALAPLLGHLRCLNQGWLLCHSGCCRRSLVLVCQES